VQLTHRQATYAHATEPALAQGGNTTLQGISSRPPFLAAHAELCGHKRGTPICTSSKPEPGWRIVKRCNKNSILPAN
jgi:hypothetical protein